MSHSLSKLARIIIVISVVCALAMLTFHSYNIYRIIDTEKKIEAVMQERNVVKPSAIIILENQGVELYLGKEFTAYAGFCVSLFGLFTLYLYTKNDGFFVGFLTAFTNIFASGIGGLLLFYVILSGKSISRRQAQKVEPKNDWEKFIRKNAEEIG